MSLSSNVLIESSKAPAISFIIPTYNRASMLMACLKHLESQTFHDFEVIIVDDGSTDSTQEDVKHCLTVTPLRIRFLQQKNSGPARARNLAISRAQAPICIMIGDDIMVSPDFAATHHRFHMTNPGLNYAALGLTRWSETGQTVTPLMRWLDECGFQFGYPDLLAGSKPNWKYFYTSNLSLKSDLLRKNLFNERFEKALVEDIELGYRLEAQHGLEIGFIPDAYAEHIHPTDFRKTCSRAYGIGRNWLLLEKLWPECAMMAPKHGPVRSAMRDLLCSNRWILPPLTWLTEKLTNVWCPNPLLAPVLSYYSALGRRSMNLS